MNSSLPGQRRLKFQFRDLVIDQTQIQRDLATGTHDADRLVVGPLDIPDRNISALAVQGRQIAIQFADADAGIRIVRMVVLPNPGSLTRAINHGLSRRRYKAQLEQAAANHQAHLTRETVCPWCLAKILTLESAGWSPQVWCEYCDALITTISVDRLGDVEKDYRICPECRMYSHPRIFTEAYFYFLIVHAGVHHDQKYCCSGCMRPRAWRMLLGNLPGVLGLPLAITQLSRVYRDSTRKGPLRGLDSANRLLKRQRTERALERYSKIMERHPVSAGVLYNVSLGLIAEGDLEHARQTLHLALENCNNYRPAVEKLRLLEFANEAK